MLKNIFNKLFTFIMNWGHNGFIHFFPEQENNIDAYGHLRELQVHKHGEFGIMTPVIDWGDGEQPKRMYVTEQEFDEELNPVRVSGTEEEMQRTVNSWNESLEDIESRTEEQKYIVVKL